VCAWEQVTSCTWPLDTPCPAEHGAGGDGPQHTLFASHGCLSCGPRLSLGVRLQSAAGQTLAHDFADVHCRQECGGCLGLHHAFFMTITLWGGELMRYTTSEDVVAAAINLAPQIRAARTEREKTPGAAITRPGTRRRRTLAAPSPAIHGRLGNPAADGKQRPLVPRSRCLPRLTPGVRLLKLHGRHCLKNVA
jgi:hypothetical protein